MARIRTGRGSGIGDDRGADPYRPGIGMRQRRAARASATRSAPPTARSPPGATPPKAAPAANSPPGSAPRGRPVDLALDLVCHPVAAEQTAVGVYPDRDTHRPQTWDQIDLGGLDLAKAEVSRPLPAGNSPRARPPPGSSSTVLANLPGIPYASHVPDGAGRRSRWAISPHRLVAQDAALSRR
ncbi:hypothetical protein GCM10010246_72300 [Streptomyces cuspidosporus]|uniref:Uncharacterized protein n=1 Tax=Streptomyces cuspidosporus TaxID=66882 RepID=A0ABP5U3F0_9ACTN